MNRKIYILIVAIVFICLYWGCKKKENTLSQQDKVQAVDEKTYRVLHHWDNFDFRDTTCIHRPDVIEQTFVDFINTLPHHNSVTIQKSIENMLEQAQLQDSTKTVYKYILNLYKHYLYDPNSPFRNEELYIPVLEYVLKNKSTDEVVKIQTEFNLKMVLKNRLGTMASNITYTLANGSSNTLYALESPYVILYFYNPDCTACKEASSFLKSSNVINGLLQNSKLSILAIYTDTDLALWKKHLNEVPNNWITCYDKEQLIKKEWLYELRAIPSLYLLDNNKYVLLKDANVLNIEKHLSSAL